MKVFSFILLLAVVAVALADDRKCPRRLYDKIQEAKAKGLIGWDSIPPADTEEYSLRHDSRWQALSHSGPIDTTTRYTLQEPQLPFEELPESFTVTDKWSHASSHVYNQAACGSCWAFSVSTMMIDNYNAMHNEDVIISPQRMISCDNSFFDSGCHGGVPSMAERWLAKNYVTTMECQAYTSGMGDDGVCHNKCDDGSDPKEKYSIKDIKSYSGIKGIMHGLYENGPVSVGFQVPASFMCYSTGIYEPIPNDEIEGGHAVVAVGYGSENGKKFLRIRNSWGTTWAESITGEVTENDGGYFRMSYEAVEDLDMANSGIGGTAFIKK